MQCIPYGDCAVLVNFKQEISLPTHAKVAALEQALQNIEGITFTIPAYCSLTVGYDPAVISFDTLCKKIEDKSTHKATTESEVKSFKIPVCYHEDFAPDLSTLAEQLKMTKDELINHHTAQPYHVYMVGFIPGFAYMGKTHPSIQCKRKESPRRIVPTRSVGLAGSQTGIYPFAAPGGWQLIGKTPINTFEVRHKNPFLFNSGDKVSFYPVSKKEYEQLEVQVNEGAFKLESLYE